MNKYTIEDAKKWAEENAAELTRSRLSSKSPEVQMFNRQMPEKSEEIWNSSCWMARVLRNHGATDQQVSETQFAQGQRAFGASAWIAAVEYANEFAARGEVADKPGEELAEKIFRRVTGL